MWLRFALITTAITGLALLPFYGSAQTTAPKDQLSSDGSAYVIYLSPNGETVCRDASLAAARTRRSTASDVGFRQINHLKQGLAPESSSGETTNANGLTIILRASAQLEQNPQAKAAFIAAAAKWEALIQNPITVVIDVDYGPTVFGLSFPNSNVLGMTATQELYYTGNYSDVRNRLISHASNSSEAALLSVLPAGGSVPTDIGNANT